MHYVCTTKALFKNRHFSKTEKLCFDCTERPAYSTFNYCIFAQESFHSIAIF